MDSLVTNFSSKSSLFTVFYNGSGHFSRKKHFFISSRLSAVYRGFSVLASETGCSSCFMKASPAQTQVQTYPFSANTRSEKSRTPPDRSATPYYVQSFQFQPGTVAWTSKISKVLSKTLPGSPFSGLTASDVNIALLIESAFACKVVTGVGDHFLWAQCAVKTITFFQLCFRELPGSLSQPTVR